MRPFGDVPQPCQRVSHLAGSLIPPLLRRPFGLSAVAVPGRAQLGDGTGRMREMTFELLLERRHPIRDGQQRGGIDSERAHKPIPEIPAALE